MKRFDYARRLNIGNQVAENDWQILKDNFIEIGASSFVGIEAPSIILGRKGAGKTALRLHLEKQNNSKRRTTSLEPSYTDLLESFDYIITKEKSNYTTEFIAKLWEVAAYLGIIHAMPAETLQQLKDGPDLPSHLIEALKNRERFGIGRTLGLFEKHFGTNDARDRLSRALKRQIRELLRTSDTKYFVLIDSVDDVLHNTVDSSSRSDLFSTFFEGLWAFFRSFVNLERNELASKVFLQIFVPLDLYNWSDDRHADHRRQYKHSVNWTPPELEDFIISRLARNLSKADQRSLAKMDQERRRAEVWNTFFPSKANHTAYLPSKSLKFPVSTRNTLIEMTLRRPRDLQEVVRQIDEHTKYAKMPFPDERILVAALEKYSLELTRIVEKEYSFVLPEMPRIFAAFSGNDTVIHKNTMEEIIGKIVGSQRQAIKETIHTLYEACVVGVVRNGHDGAGDVTFYYDVDDFDLLWEPAKHLAIHRAFWHALQLQPLLSKLG